MYFSVDEWAIERDLLKCTTLCQHSTTTARKGCIQPPLLNIPFQFVVVDTLHLFLRIMGLLFHQVSTHLAFLRNIILLCSLLNILVFKHLLRWRTTFNNTWRHAKLPHWSEWNFLLIQPCCRSSDGKQYCMKKNLCGIWCRMQIDCNIIYQWTLINKWHSKLDNYSFYVICYSIYRLLK